MSWAEAAQLTLDFRDLQAVQASAMRLRLAVGAESSLASDRGAVGPGLRLESRTPGMTVDSSVACQVSARANRLLDGLLRDRKTVALRQGG